MPVYLLHYHQPYPGGRRPRHYLGYAKNARTLAARIEHHRQGTSGATLPAVMHAAGIGFDLARAWPDGDQALERRLKNRKRAAKLCPACRGEEPAHA